MSQSAESSSSCSRSLDLLSFCRRAIGEWQSLDVHQGFLVDVEPNQMFKNVGKFRAEIGTFNVAEIPPTFSIPCTRVTLCELFESDFMGTMRSPFANGQENLAASASANICSVQSISSWCGQNDSKQKYIFPANDGKEPEGTIIKCPDSLSTRDIEDVFWALRLCCRDFAIVPSILLAIEGLKGKGFDSWLLPGGLKVPLDSLQMRVMEVSPSQLFVFRTLRYYQLGYHSDSTYTSMMIPYPDIPDVTRSTLVRRYDPKLGLVVTHVVLQIQLEDGTCYIVDPTSMQYGYRGPHGTVIAHGEYSSYVKKFPGIVGDTVTTPRGKYDTLKDEIFCIGDGGQLKFVSKMVHSILKYFGQRSCTHCGRIEGDHPVKPRMEMRYYFRPLSLLDCARCKNVWYCGPFCQKLNWKDHKGNCKGASTAPVGN